MLKSNADDFNLRAFDLEIETNIFNLNSSVSDSSVHAFVLTAYAFGLTAYANGIFALTFSLKACAVALVVHADGLLAHAFTLNVCAVTSAAYAIGLNVFAIVAAAVICIAAMVISDLAMNIWIIWQIAEGSG